MVKKDEMLELDITGMTHEGLGVGKKDGFAIFVQGAIGGERVRAKIIKVLKNYAVARIDQFIRKSPSRLLPFCPVYKRCGGCSLQHMTYDRTLDFKRQVVIDNLTRIGGLSDIEVHETIGMAEPLSYRNKAQYPVGIGKEGAIAGFFARHSHEIVHSEQCAIQHPVSDKAKAIVLDFIGKHSIPIYDESTCQGVIRHIVTKIGFQTGEVMVIIVSAKSELLHCDKLVESLKKGVPNLKSVVLNVNSKPGNVILGKQNIVLFGKETIEDRIGDLTFEISPLSFYQVNPIQTEKLYEQAMQYADLTGEETVFDLYCGIGTIALFAAKKAKMVIGVEVEEEAIEAAKRNAEKNNIKNAEFLTGEAEKLTPALAEKGIKADVIFVDPPRKGCTESLLKTLVELSPQKIVYISCNPSTLARDLKYLATHAYKAVEAQPVDMFPWTEHVECVVLMSRVEK